ncbi:MAG TPA: hypothetical protein VGD69_20255 [Herpetosiphonaceae bacterium]
MEIWEVWYPNAAADGLLIARGKLEPTDVLWLHAAPDTLRAEVRTMNGERRAFGDQLKATGDFPMTRLSRHDDSIRREDRWPAQEDVGSLVILPGGEVGRLTAWWNADDGQEWRWSVEFYNHR